MHCRDRVFSGLEQVRPFHRLVRISCTDGEQRRPVIWESTISRGYNSSATRGDWRLDWSGFFASAFLFPHSLVTCGRKETFSSHRSFQLPYLICIGSYSSFLEPNGSPINTISYYLPLSRSVSGSVRVILLSYSRFVGIPMHSAWPPHL